MRKLESQGRRILPGLWQINSKTWVVRAQKISPFTKRKINRRKVVENATRTEALRHLEEMRQDLAVLCAAPPQEELPEEITSQDTLGDFAESWLRAKKGRGDLAESTLDRYATALDHLSAHLTHLPLADVAPRDVEAWMIASRKKYAEATINGWLRVLRACLADAVRDGLVMRNAAQAVRSLKVRADLEETNSLTADELHQLLAVLAESDPIIHAAALTQALTGMRWGEVSALMWQDHDTHARVVRIRRSVSQRQLRPMTKTGKARVVGIPRMLAVVLAEHRERLIADQHPGLGSGLMFPSKRGTPLTSARISEALRKACAAAGIKKRFTSHGFRRTMTDLLRAAAVDPVIAAGLTGHETERMRRHYSTVRDSEAVDAGERVARLVQPFSESTEGLPQESTEESTA